jgi:hypothetical protein
MAVQAICGDTGVERNGASGGVTVKLEAFCA